MEPAAELINVSKSYGEKPPVLRNITLTLPRNRVTALFGPNGAGKSTLLKIMALLEPATSGRFKILGTEVESSKHHPLRGRVAMVFQSPIVFDRSVYDNIAYGLTIKGLSKEEVDHRVKELAEALGLGQLLHSNAKTLSGGQKQRVVIARTLAVEPELLLLDEANANLDSEGVKILDSLIKELASSSTIVVSTPTLHYALRISNHFVLLDGGEIPFADTKDAFTSSPLFEQYRY